MSNVKILSEFRFIISALCGFIFFISCSNDVTTKNDNNDQSEKSIANVISVSVSGDPRNYQFAVGIQSPDTGCDQYADWWEVLSEEGSLIYRRILAHSHVNEQPFVRSGGPVPIAADDVVYVRAHMHPEGYGGAVLKGTVQDGFEEASVTSDFALEVETEDPQPGDCAF